MRVACRLAREVLDKAHAAVRPGVTTDEIDRIVSQIITAIPALRHLPVMIMTLALLCYMCIS